MSTQPNPEPTPSSQEVAAHQARADLDNDVAVVGELIDRLVAVDPSGRWLLTFLDANFADPLTVDTITPLLHELYRFVDSANTNLSRWSAIVQADDNATRIWSAPGFTAIEDDS